MCKTSIHIFYRFKPSDNDNEVPTTIKARDIIYIILEVC